MCIFCSLPYNYTCARSYIHVVSYPGQTQTLSWGMQHVMWRYHCWYGNGLLHVARGMITYYVVQVQPHLHTYLCCHMKKFTCCEWDWRGRNQKCESATPKIAQIHKPFSSPTGELGVWETTYMGLETVHSSHRVARQCNVADVCYVLKSPGELWNSVKIATTDLSGTHQESEVHILIFHPLCWV